MIERGMESGKAVTSNAKSQGKRTVEISTESFYWPIRYLKAFYDHKIA